MSPPGSILSNSLIKTYAELRNSPLHSDLKIVSKNQTYYGHKVIFYTRSKKWGRDKTLAGASVLNWTQWSDQTSSYFSLGHLVTQCESSLFRLTQFQNLLQLFLKLVKNFRSKLKSTSKRSSLKVKSIISQKRAGREISVHCNTISWRTS